MSITTGIALWLGKQGAQAAWPRILTYFKPDALRKQIESALRSDNAVADVCQPLPKLDRARLTQDRTETLLQVAVTKDTEALGKFLIDEQLVDLPVRPDKRPESYTVVWQCIANAIIGAVCVAVAKDAELSRQFALMAQRIGHLEHQQILGELENLRTQTNELNEEILASLGEIKEQLVSTPAPQGISDSTLVRTANLLNEENERLERDLREQLDEKASQLWDDILGEIQNNNFREAVSKGSELERWLESRQGNLSSAIQGRGYLLLAQISLIATSEFGDNSGDLNRAHQLLAKSQEAFGDKPSDENRSRLICFQAKLLSARDCDEEALMLLSGRDDAHSLTTHLLIHIDRNESDLAAKLVSDRPYDVKWCEHAIYAFARSGNDSKAAEALSWAIEADDAGLERRCREALARGTLSRLSHENAGSAALRLRTDSATVNLLNNVQSKLEPIIAPCRARNKISSGLDADVIGYAYTIARLVGSHNDATELASLLRDRSPIHFEYAMAIIRGDVAPDASAAMRLRSDHPSHFMAGELALGIDIQQHVDANELLDRASELAHLASTPDDKLRLARCVMQVCTSPAIESFDRPRTIISQLVGDDHFLMTLSNALEHSRKGETELFERTISRLDGVQDFLIDQFRAQLLVSKGDFPKAAEILASVGRTMCEPELLKQAARLALDGTPKRFDIAISAASDALVLSPDDCDALRMLAYSYVQLQGFPNAAECFKKLHELQPAEHLHELNLAQSLRLSNRPLEALEVLKKLCSRDNAPLHAFLAQATLLCDLGKSHEGFDLLHSIRDIHWDLPDFVLTYMNTAHAANREKFAAEGLQQLWTLRQTGKAPPEILQPKSFEDVIKWSDAERERRKFLQDGLLKGRLPWVFVERLSHNVPYWAWRLRTQRQPWIADEPRTRASYSIYATNSYAVLPGDDGPSLQRIGCSPSGSPVVVDLSALITIHRLGLLKKSIEFFGAIKLPPSYLSEVVQQSGRLRPHQLSEKVNYEAIHKAIASKAVKVLIDNTDRADLKVVNEYGDDNERTYTIRDVLNLLHRLGRISKQQMDECLQVAHKPEAASVLGKTLEASDKIEIDLQTLRVLTGQGLLNTCCGAFDAVSISRTAHERLAQELQAYDVLAETQTWHDDLWSQLDGEHRVDYSTLVMYEHEVDESDEGDDEWKRSVALDSLLLSKQQKLPLLADDRFCQNAILHSDFAGPSAAFGTDCLLIGLLSAGLLEEREAIEGFLKLLEWRYRFLIIPVDMLLTIARDFAEHDLRNVARYVHESMRDPGLFAGLEQTNPPMPIAFRYYQDWLAVIAAFVARIWLDEAIDEGRAKELTNWAMTEFVPTVPSNLQGPGRTANFSAMTVLLHALNILIETADYAKANKALRQIARDLGISESDFIRISGDIINSYGRVSDG